MLNQDTGARHRCPVAMVDTTACACCFFELKNRGVITLE